MQTPLVLVDREAAHEIEAGVSGDRVGPEEVRALLAEALGESDERVPLSDLLRDARETSDLHALRTSARLRNLV